MKKTLIIVGLLIICVPAACTPLQQQGQPSGQGYAFDLRPEDLQTLVDNPYFPLTPGTKWVYEAAMEDGTTEHTEVEVLRETHQVMGIEATAVRDTVSVDGQILEDTIDWYAQDKEGNVWYLGEDVDNYEDVVLTNHAGSWEWGKDGALPGIIMWADPAAHLNEVYFQEYYAGEAEDQGQVLSVNESVSVPFGDYEDVVQTYDFSALEPDVKSHKFYAAGIGTIKEIELGGNEEVLLIDFVPGG